MLSAALAVLGALVYGSADFLGGLAATRLRSIVVTAVAALSGLVALAPVGYIGLALALVAVLLVGFIPGDRIVRPSLRGLLMALGAGLAIGAFLIIVDQTSADSGLAPLVASRATSGVITVAVVGALALAAMRRGLPARSVLAVAGPQLGATPSGHADLEHAATGSTAVPSAARAWWLAAVCGVADAAVNALMLLALREGDLSIVSALTALYPAGTILLAAVVLRERVAAVQWTGLGLALLAGGLLALA
ncbi:EamA family transporter [Streptomyces sp. G2]|uniref:EamA family transporter n=1 Tax=Streptomyces sp. G2 TaxID=1684471 RepID=UPI00202FA997|nr:EamA family transporter [Streptomyces sp. G2]MCM1951427.1 EamA family transporter [Streptomyces sp. G2]